MNGGSRLVAVVRTLLLGVLIAAALLGGMLWLAGRKASAFIERGLRAEVIKDPRKADFARVDVSFFSGRVSVFGVRMQNAGRRGSAGLEVAEMSVQLPVLDLLRGKRPLPTGRIVRPALRITPSTAAASGEEEPEVSTEAEAARAAAHARAITTVVKRLHSRAITVEDGSLRLESPSGGSALVLDSISASLERLEPSGYALRASGRLAQTKSGFSLEARLADLSSPCESEGQVKINQFPVAAAAAYFPPDPEVRFKKGTASLTTQFNCKKGWLTASHFVEIKDFDVEVSTGRKELFGVSVKYLKDLFKIDALSFVVPMTGDFSDPHIGISSSIQQILLKIVEGKFDNKEDAEKLARRGGDYFGGKLDKALKAWLKARRR